MNRLLTNEAMSLLAKVGEVDSKTDVLALISSLRKAGHDAVLVAEVVTQARLRSRARTKFGEFASQMLFTEAGLEQATRLDVAALHAERFRAAGFSKIADLGCGIGSDAMAMAALNLDVTAVELDPETAALAAFNLASFEAARVLNKDAQSINTENFDALWLDPARRDLASKGPKHTVLRPEDFTPNLDWVFSLDKPKGVKLGPAFPLELIPSDAQAQWVSHRGDLVELTLWFGALRGKAQVVAIMLKESGRYQFEGTGKEPAALGTVGEYIYEPDPTLIRSGLMGEFANQNGLNAISTGIAYLSSSSQLITPWLKTYRILEQLPLDERVIRGRLAELGVGSLEIKKRGVDITPEQLRPKLKLKGENAATLILTRVDGARRALIVEPIR